MWVSSYSKAHCLQEPTLHHYDTSCSSYHSALCCENIRGIFITHPCRADGSGMPSHRNHFYALVELTARTAHSDTATVFQLDLVTTVLYCVSKLTQPHPYLEPPDPNMLTYHSFNMLHCQLKDNLFPFLQTQRGEEKRRDNRTLQHSSALMGV